MTQLLTAEQVQIIDQAESAIHAYHDYKTAQVERRNLFCEAIAESDAKTLDNILSALDEGNDELLGRSVRRRAKEYSLLVQEKDLSAGELEIYLAIRESFDQAGIAASETTADDEISEYEYANDCLIPKYPYNRIKACLEMYLGLKSVEEK
jgi:hypothetical protein